MLQLTTGTTSPPKPNSPITGTAGSLSFEDDSQILVLDGYRLVDNAFSVPGATGCGGINSSIVDPAVEAAIELPSEHVQPRGRRSGAHRAGSRANRTRESLAGSGVR